AHEVSSSIIPKRPASPQDNPPHENVYTILVTSGQSSAGRASLCTESAPLVRNSDGLFRSDFRHAKGSRGAWPPPCTATKGPLKSVIAPSHGQAAPYFNRACASTGPNAS